VSGRVSRVPLLATIGLRTGFGGETVLAGVSVDVSAGEVVSVFGGNGSGKTTLLRAIYGLQPIWEGRVILDGVDVARVQPWVLLRGGVLFVPQGTPMFEDLSVAEHLTLRKALSGLGRYAAASPELLAVYAPRLLLSLRQAARTLSGGEQQVLGMAAALSVHPRVLLVDEPSQGLAQPAARDMLSLVRRIADDTGAGVLLAEHRWKEALQVSDRVYALRAGRVVVAERAENVRDVEALRRVVLGQEAEGGEAAPAGTG
jgi:branched-chain amino acid transport system ATP-binding protein